MDWLRAAAQLRDSGEAGVLITVTAVRGHAPRDAGAKMVVGTSRSWGTIGGGNLEEVAISRARAMIADGSTALVTETTKLNPHQRTEFGRQCCGGEVTVLFEPLPARPTIAVFGVGHVGFEIARIVSRWDVRLHLVDSRATELDPLRLVEITDGDADVSVHRAAVGETVLERLPRGAHVLIMTHDHAEDFALCDAALRLPAGHLGSVGLIGSRAKWSRFQVNLSREGHDPQRIAMISCPIGLPGIAGKEPAVIAVSVAAALMQTLRSGAEVTR
ncbi:MAG TPA: xanthine dehydrogenase accessory protein XdhC [Microlunatus sp.]|nr:xanthine dehydrogenase accessory protein XdhC [Microlunatus sp.]